MIGTLKLSLDDWANKRKLALATLTKFSTLQAKINASKNQSSQLLASIKAFKGKNNSSKVWFKTLQEQVVILNAEIVKKREGYSR